MKLMILLGVAGVCCGLQYPLQYHYHYRAKVSAGIPEINENHAAVSVLRSDLLVYVKSPTRIVFKLDNVEFGSHNGVGDCKSHGGFHPNVEYLQPQAGPGAMLGKYPFALESGAMIFHAQEYTWVINFYKSIVALFKIEPLKETFFSAAAGDIHSTAYTTTEDTVMGKCNTTYTQHKLLGVEAAQHELFVTEHVIRDVQRSTVGALTGTDTSKTTPGRKARSTKKPPSKTTKTSPLTRAPAISSALWKVKRSVNLETCDDRVEHQHALTSVQCLLSKDQCENLLSRNSHGTFVLRGDKTGLRIEKAVVKGAIIVSPFGYETEHLETFTKQEIALVSVEHLNPGAPNLNDATTKTETHMTHTMTIPYTQDYASTYRWARGGTMKEVMQSLTGNVITPNKQLEIEKHVIELVKMASTAITSGNTTIMQKAPVFLNYATTLCYDFTTEELLRVVNAVPADQLDLIHGVLAAIGTHPAVTVFLNAIETGQVTPSRQAIFFGTLNNNIKSATPLRPILDFLLKQTLDAAPFKTSQALVNFASLVQRLCNTQQFDPYTLQHTAQNSFRTLASKQCIQDDIVNKFQQFLIAELEHTTKFWKQMVLVKALVNLKTVPATNAVLPYALGSKQCDPAIRAMAMTSLASWNAADARHAEKITHILLNIFENPAEDRVLRARALGFLVSWPISSTQWTRLALSTKKNNLKDLSAFTYSIIKNTAEFDHPIAIQRRQLASHALRLAKPSSTGHRYSSVFVWFNYVSKYQRGSLSHFTYISDPLSILPAHLSAYLQLSSGGVTLHKMGEAFLANDDGNLYNVVQELFRNAARPEQDPGTTGRWTNFLNMLKTDLPLEQKARTAIRGVISLMHLPEVELIIPLQHDFLANAMAVFSPDGAIMSGPKAFFANFLDLTFVTVNDLGLPVLANVAHPTVTNYETTARISIKPDRSYALELKDKSHMFGTVTRVNIETFIPWAHVKVATGVSHSLAVNLPFSWDLLLAWKRPARQDSFFVLKTAPNAHKKVGLMSMSTVPYTLMRDPEPVHINEIAESMLPVTSAPQQKKTLPLGLGLLYSYQGHGEVNLDAIKQAFRGGDVKLEHILKKPSLQLTTEDLTMSLFGTEGVALVFNVTKAHVNTVSKSSQDRELCGADSADDLTQQSTGQQSTDDISWEDDEGQQISQNAAHEFESFGGSEQHHQQQQQQATKPARLSATDTETVRPSQGVRDIKKPALGSFLHYLQAEAGWKHRVDGFSVRAEVLQNNEVLNAVELLFASTSCYTLHDQKNVKHVFVATKTDDPCFTKCWEMETVQPTLSDLDTLLLIGAKNLTKISHYNFYTGKQCSTSVGTSKVELEYSHTRLNKLLEEAEQAGSCPGDSVDALQEFYRRAQYDSAYTRWTIPDLQQVKCGMEYYVFIKMYNRMLSLFKLPHLEESESLIGAANEVKITGRREDDDLWHFLVHQPSRKVTAASVSTGIFYHEFRLSEAGYTHPQYCIIDDHSVTTFDKLHVNVTFDECPAVAVTTCEEGQKDVFAVAVKKVRTGGFVVHVASQYKQLVVNLYSDSVQVNNVPVEPNARTKTLYYTDSRTRTQQVAGHVYKSHGFYKVEVQDTVAVIYKEGKIYIKIDDRFKGYTCGLCGNLDWEAANDLKEPNGCLLKNPDHFVKSWTPSSGLECVGKEHHDPESCLKESLLPTSYYEQYQL